MGGGTGVYPPLVVGYGVADEKETQVNINRRR